MNAIQTLYDFLERAKKERKYADNTVGGFKAALKLFEASLNDGEKESLDKLQANLPTIADDVYAKNRDNFSSSTVMIYKRRIANLIKDYKRYGDSPSKMANWNPRRLSSLGSKKEAPKKSKIRDSAEIIDPGARKFIEAITAPVSAESAVTTFDSTGAYRELNRSEVYVRPGLKVSLELPSDLSQREADKLKQFIDVMVAIEDEKGRVSET